MDTGITKIQELINIGIFDNFSWPSESPELIFKKINLIYGFNGSGKTTLSSVIDLLSEDHSESKKNELAIALSSDEDKPISLNIEWDGMQVKSFLDSKKVYVFNSHFVSDHVYDGTRSNVKSFKGGVVTEDQLANPLINELTNDIDTDKIKKDKGEDAKLQLKSMAEEIKKSLSKLWNENIKGNRMPTGLELDNSQKNVFLESEEDLQQALNDQFKIFKVSKDKDSLQRDIILLENYDLTLCNIPENLNSLLSKSISQSAKDSVQEKINTYKKHSLKHASHQNWFEDGSILLKNSLNDGICPLCDSNILDIEDIISKYDAYFNNELENFLIELQGAIDAISVNVDVIENCQERVVVIQEMLGRYQYHSILTSDEDKTFKHINLAAKKKLVIKLAKNIKDKKSDISKKIGEIENNLINEVVSNLSELNDNIRTIYSINKKLVKKLKGSLFDPQKAKEICKKLFWKRFDVKGGVIANKYREDNKMDKPNEQGGIEFFIFLKIILSDIDACILSKEGEREIELSKLKKESEYVNKFLCLLCVSNFSINITEDDDITITYKGKKPKRGIRHSLSEGEKTALAFAYFLSKYKYEVIDNKSDKINQEDFVVVIDDPISSLDENRLFSTALIIHQYLIPVVSKVNSNDGIDDIMWSGCKQIVITSHNLVFLKFLSNVLESKQNKGRGDFYLEEGEIQTLPDWFRNYQTSYFYKLSKLESFAESQIDYNSVKDSLPNYIRVILETFLSFKFARLKGKDKYTPPMLDKLISHLDGYDFTTYQPVDKISDKASLKAVLQEIRNKTNPESHGTVQDITHLEYLSETELRKLAKQTVNVVQYLDQMHYTVAQKLG